MKIERRFVQAVECRADEGQKPILRGHAAVFNSVADLGRFKEIIEPGAFQRTIQEDAEDIVALWNHNPDFPLARMGYGLSLREDETGLASEIEPDIETSVGKDVARYVANKSVRGMSIGFFIPTAADQRIEKRGGDIYRIIVRARLLDVSPVTYPAYKSTDIALRSADEVLSDLQLPEEQSPRDWAGELAVYRRRLELVGK